MATTREELRMRVVLFEEDGEWVAQCLEYDIGAQAGTLRDLFYELQRSLFGHMVISWENGVEPFSGLGEAPQDYWDKWQQLQEYPIEVTPPPMPFSVPGMPPPQVEPAPAYLIAA